MNTLERLNKATEMYESLGSEDETLSQFKNIDEFGEVFGNHPTVEMSDEEILEADSD